MERTQYDLHPLDTAADLNKAERREINGNLIAWLIIIIALVLAVCASAGPLTPGRTGKPLGVTHFVFTVTTWSDGSAELSPTVELTADRASRLALQLVAADQETQEPAAAAPGDTQDPKDTRCQALATSTGLRCRKTALKGQPFCSHHMPKDAGTPD